MIDLHTHSLASDGSDAPADVLRRAVEKGLSGVALTDHDTISGLHDFMTAAEGKNIEAVPGVEISSFLYNKEIHILGLFIDPSSESLHTFLAQARENRNRRNQIMLEKLNAIGYEITEEELQNEAGGESVGRPHFAKILVRKGYFTDIQEAFAHCLKRGARAYTPRQPASPQESIEAIHAAGGLAFWAHPVYQKPGERSFVRRYLRHLVPLGLDGIEAYYSLYSLRQHQMLKEMAVEFGLLICGGTDYHGIHHPGIELGSGGGGLNIPDSVLENIRRKARPV